MNLSRVAGGSKWWRSEYELSQLRQGRVSNGTDKGRGSGLAQELLPVRAVRQAAQRRQLREPREHALL